jgi:hypothetical protein
MQNNNGRDATRSELREESPTILCLEGEDSHGEFDYGPV